MGWEHRGGRSYYYTAERVGGHVVKTYIGTGRVAELAADMDADRRAEKDAEAERDRQDLEQLVALDSNLNDVNELADTLTAAALVAAGFHRHRRGPWRKRRA